MFDRNIRAINYSVDCIRSTVYLMGIARTPAELQRVIDHVRDVPYVRAVVNHVRVRTDPLPAIPTDKPTFAASTDEPAPPGAGPQAAAKAHAMTASLGEGPRWVGSAPGAGRDRLW